MDQILPVRCFTINNGIPVYQSNVRDRYHLFNNQGILEYWEESVS